MWEYYVFFIIITLKLVRVLAFTDSFIKLCQGINLDLFTYKRAALFFEYDSPILFMLLANGFFGLSLFHIAFEKKSHSGSTLQPTLWSGFVISYNILIIILFGLNVIGEIDPDKAFHGVYTYF